MFDSFNGDFDIQKEHINNCGEYVVTSGLTDDAKKLGRPSGFKINVREVYASAGAGFVVAVNGSIMTMPGLSKKPAAYGIDVDDNGVTMQTIDCSASVRQKIY